MLAQLMVEYMDCWAECPTRLGGTLLELEQENLWTHILKISDDDNLGDITPIDQVKLKIYSVYGKVRKLEDDFALEQLRTSGERDEIKARLERHGGPFPPAAIRFYLAEIALGRELWPQGAHIHALEAKLLQDANGDALVARHVAA